MTDNYMCKNMLCVLSSAKRPNSFDFPAKRTVAKTETTLFDIIKISFMSLKKQTKFT